MSAGWDRTAWLVDERWVFGFPRRTVVVSGIERELAWLPRLAPLLPAPIPVPAFTGEPSDAFPWAYFGYELLPGLEAAEVPDDVRVAVALDLAAFLRVLHSPELAVAIGAHALPLDGNARADMMQRVPRVRGQLRDLETAGLWWMPGVVRRLLDQAERLPPPAAPATVAHGDLHIRHALVHGGRLSGVIDWVDLCRSDPAIDLALYWMWLPVAGREAFLRAYGSVDEERLLRARVVALTLGSALALYAHDEGAALLKASALDGLELTATS